MGTYGYKAGTIQTFTATNGGSYSITAYGGQGGSDPYSTSSKGGYGAEASGQFLLVKGEKLEIVVGGAGAAGAFGGGGGGSFVLGDVNAKGVITQGHYYLLLAAGGGGGAGDGKAGSPGLSSTAGGGAGGAAGTGAFGAGGGAGINSPGGTTTGTTTDKYPATGGSNASGSFAGGAGVDQSEIGGKGGFGGGGGGANGGGGGGGYSGGAGGSGGSAGGGGYSSDAGAPNSAMTRTGVETGMGKVLITLCYASGTMIRTAEGDVAVDTLAVGDLVVTASGEAQPVKWLGHRTIDCRRHPSPREAMPVRIAAHAFGEDRPSRDLHLSPGHSVCVDVVGGVLIPIGRLVNGATIAQIEVDTVTYWHVELDDHDIVLAENLPCESYIDCGTRTFFAESRVVALGASPDAPVLTTNDYCRPFKPEGMLVDMVRDRLCQRAADLGWRLAVEDELAGLWLEVDGARIEPARHGLLARATLPADAREVRVRSASAVPATIHGGKDERRLGLQLASVVIDDGLGCRREIACADERLVDGFHPHEGRTAGPTATPGCRPSCGRAAAATSAFASLSLGPRSRAGSRRPLRPSRRQRRPPTSLKRSMQAASVVRPGPPYCGLFAIDLPGQVMPVGDQDRGQAQRETIKPGRQRGGRS